MRGREGEADRGGEAEEEEEALGAAEEEAVGGASRDLCCSSLQHVTWKAGPMCKRTVRVRDVAAVRIASTAGKDDGDSEKSKGLLRKPCMPVDKLFESQQHKVKDLNGKRFIPGMITTTQSRPTIF